MKKSKTAKAAIAAVLLSTTACSMDMSGVDMSTGPLVGAAIGGVAGGFLGAQFGGGLGQVLYATAGTVSGMIVGYSTGRSLMPGDRMAYNAAVSTAMTVNQELATADWDNPSSGNGGVIRAGKSFAGVNGQSCRTYRATVAFTDDIVSGDGAACRDANGHWVLVADAFS